ncbi:glutaredoxin domain-containing cysteine-rich protein CG31559-like isoform X2 [Haliotis cracherodii]|uniref:glutaredoxin domain-containing cysteine-rich protein CG31559-like isoform X2 n=1 Tax=Haliotis cracherodii TaxID=6455 RepID=UPI0039ED3F4A
MSRVLNQQSEQAMRGPLEMCNGVEPHPPSVGPRGLEQHRPPQFHSEIMGKAASAIERRLNDGEFRLTNGRKLDSDPIFAGRRNVRDPSTLQERQIVSPRGTVRGYRNRVRAGIATFLDPISDKRNYRQQEKGKIVIYTTSMCVVRDTWEKCKVVRNILQTHMVRYEERDLYMSRDHQRELQDRLATDHIDVPHVFADGIHLGDSNEFQTLNETGELRDILENFPKINVRSSCGKCGGYRFVPCSHCHGSKKSLHRNHFTEEFHALRCMQCDESGLQRCDMCLDQQE